MLAVDVIESALSVCLSVGLHVYNLIGLSGRDGSGRLLPSMAIRCAGTVSAEYNLRS